MTVTYDVVQGLYGKWWVMATMQHEDGSWSRWGVTYFYTEDDARHRAAALSARVTS